MIRITNLFLGQPTLDCEGSTNLLVLTLGTWGSLNITLSGQSYLVQIAGELEVTIIPDFIPEFDPDLIPIPRLKLKLEEESITVRQWEASILSSDAPPEIDAFILGDQAKELLEGAIRSAFEDNKIDLPTIDISFFGPLGELVTSAAARIRSGVLLLGLNVDNEDYSFIGEEADLVDFALGYDLAGVINPQASILFLKDLHDLLLKEIKKAGASLAQFSVEPLSGRFKVSGKASQTGGSLDFSFQLVPDMFHVRPGKYFRYMRKPRWVNHRTYAALKFNVEAVNTDSNPSWWAVLLGTFVGPVGILYVYDKAWSAADSFSGQVKAKGQGTATPRIQRTIPPPGGVSIRIGLDRFDISTDGTIIRFSIKETASPFILLGPKTIPVDYIGERLLYRVQLPSGIVESDPALYIHWQLEDRSNSLNLIDADTPANGNLSIDFVPSQHPNVTDFGIIVRLYRKLGPNIFEIETSSLNIHIREPLPEEAYIRWNSQVKNPQITYDADDATWNYRGEARVKRWSKWHRLDARCNAVHAPNRYRHNKRTAGRLPFPLRKLEARRNQLCPYCFFGGPAGVNAEL